MAESTPRMHSFVVQRMRGLRNGALACAAFLFCMVPWRLLGAPGPGPMRLLALHAALWGLGLLLYALLLHARRRAAGDSTLAELGLMLFGLGTAASQLVLYRRMQETAAILIISLASGAVLQRRGALVAFQALLVTTWIGLAVRVAGGHAMATWLFDVVLAGLLAFCIQRLLALRTEALLRRIARQHQLLRDLRQATQNIQTLTGLIPICAQCKKIRNDGGYWEQVESYLAAHSEIQFTHGICPTCAEVMKEELRSQSPV